MIFFKRKKSIDPDRRDRVLETSERRDAQQRLKQRVEKMMTVKSTGGLNPAKG